MSRRFVLLVAASFSCTRPNPLFELTGADPAPPPDSDTDLTTGPDDAPGPAATTDDAPPDPTEAPVTTTGDPIDPGTTTASTSTTTSTSTTADPVDTEGDTCDTACTDPVGECIGGVICSGELEWLRRSGDASIQRAADAAVLSDGSVIVVGNFTGELGTAPDVITATTDPQGGDGFIYRLGPDGQQMWIRQFGGPGLQWATAVAALSGDRIAVAGHFTDQLTLGPHMIGGVGTGPAFIAIFDADGISSTVHILGGDAVQALDVAPGPDDDILVAGRYLGDIVVAGNKSPSDATDLFVVRLDPVIGPVSSYLPHAADDQIAHAVAVAPSGDILLAGELHGELTIAGIPIIADLTDGFVASLDPDAAPQWATRLGGLGNDYARAIASSDDGFVVAGVHGGGLDFGDGPLPDTEGLLGGYIAAYDPAGDLRWAHAGFILGADLPGVAIDLHGDVVASFPVGDGPLDFGSGPLGGLPGALLVKFTSNGALVWGRHLEGQVTPFGPGLGLGPAGEIAVAGAFDPTLEHQSMKLMSAGQLDVFAGRLLP